MKKSNILSFTPSDLKSGRKVAEKPDGAEKSKSVLKTWRKKITVSTRSFRGASGDGGNYVIRMQVAGQRRYVDLCTSDLDEAAKRARALHHNIHSLGWEAALLKLKPLAPQKVCPVDKLTFGEYVAAVKPVWLSQELTYWECCSKLRRLIALVLGLEAEAKDKWCGPGGLETPWQRKINGVPIIAVHPAAVTAAMESYVKARSQTTESALAAKHTVNSLVRNARSLFSRKKIVPRLTITLPVTLPFDGVKLFTEKLGEFRFNRQVDVTKLVGAAQAELADKHTAMFIIFLLALGAGLRRNEIDKLQWRELVQVAGQVEIVATEVFRPKAYASLRKVSLPIEFYQFILRFRGDAQLNSYVIPSEGKVSENVKTRAYRCAKTFAALNSWLKKHGVNPRDQKKIHALRKYFGDIICAHFGIYKACAALGHQKVSTTETFYAAPPEVEAAPLQLNSHF